MPLIDVVNFNADASCLWPKKWLHCIQGGSNSIFFQMLKNYIRYSRKVNLGLTGVTVRDLLYFNPESIHLINDHPDIFELVYRPFSHDSPLLRTTLGFRKNVQKGIEVLKNTFNKINRFYLAPEHMISGQQIYILKELGIVGTFIHRNRYQEKISDRIPDHIYQVKGVLGESVVCIPFNQKKEYIVFLHVLHGHLQQEKWTEIIKSKRNAFAFWRDGESCLLVPKGVELERRLLKAEKEKGIERIFLSEIKLEAQTIPSNKYFSFAYPSLRPWLKDMKLYWLTSRIRDIELNLNDYPPFIQTLWMLTINSDIMSSAEKDSPLIKVTPEIFSVPPESPQWIGIESDRKNNQLTLIRSERAADGEDYLAYLDKLLENSLTIEKVFDIWKNSNMPHLKKAYARIMPDFTG
ncbi:hypothetical protein KA005_45000 [bacterium]|nr:hypothetical protein [bacterium]